MSLSKNQNVRNLEQANWFTCGKDVQVYFLSHYYDSPFSGSFSYSEFMFTVKAIVAGIAKMYNVSELQAEKVFCKKNKKLLKEFEILENEAKRYGSNGLKCEYFLSYDQVGIKTLVLPAKLDKLLVDNYFYNYIFDSNNTYNINLFDDKKSLPIGTFPPEFAEFAEQAPSVQEVTGVDIYQIYNQLPIAEKVKFIEMCKKSESWFTSSMSII